MNSIDSQVERFKRGFPWMKIIAPATPQKGIKVLSEQELSQALNYEPANPVKGMCKFVPASGAASRMFKDIFAGMQQLREGRDVAPDSALARLAAGIEGFAFYDPSLFGTAEDSADHRLRCAEMLLTDQGLGYGAKPKGVIRFHRYADGESRTAFAEHLVEGQKYMRNEDGTVNLTVTISPEHTALFEEALSEVRDAYEKKYGVRYNVRFTYQDPETNTIAVDMDNKPFLKEDGTILRRPAGHGALIFNLNEVREELVSIKNIDNVSHERNLETTALYKRALMGQCLMLRDMIHAYLRELDIATGEGVIAPNLYPQLPSGYSPRYDERFESEQVQSLCAEIEGFLREELCIEMPVAKDCKTRVENLKAKLNRPVRVCGMVRNEGQPGGGPFIIAEKDGSTSLQILESVQINPDDPDAVAKLNQATHFNPVDIVCCLNDWCGNKFNLPEYVDEEAGFISSKSYQGRELKALELPGLWNGSMSDWNTMFVEVPAETFNPVKVVLDLLQPAHQ